MYSRISLPFKSGISRAWDDRFCASVSFEGHRLPDGPVAWLEMFLFLLEICEAGSFGCNCSSTSSATAWISLFLCRPLCGKSFPLPIGLRRLRIMDLDITYHCRSKMIPHAV